VVKGFWSGTGLAHSPGMTLRALRFVACSTLLTACAVPVEHAESTAQPLNSGFTFMQVVAHEDDDTLFMNPDLQNFVGAGYGTVTVVLTGGEASGTVSFAYPGCTTPSPYQSRAVFAANRQAGMRAAYASMTGMPNSWTRTANVVAGRQIEIDALNGAAQIQLVFLNLPEAGDDGLDDGGTSQRGYPGTGGCESPLMCLYDNVGASSFATMLPATGIVRTSYAYTRAAVIQELAALIAFYQPSVVRTLDAEPYLNYVRGGYEVGWDNLDHTASARFVDEALAGYTGRYATQSYKGYSLAYHEGDLGASEYSRKLAAFDSYMAHDKNAIYFVCQQEKSGTYLDPAGGGSYPSWFGATFERYPAAMTWLTQLSNGQLVAFAVQGRQVVDWIENSPGGTWTGPTSLGGGPVAPHVTSVRLPNGNVMVFVLQLPVGQAHEPPQGAEQSIIYNTRVASTGAWSGWVSLGNPDDASPGVCGGGVYRNGPELQSPCRWTGEPVAAVDGAGNAVVFARNSEGRMSMRIQHGGVFQPWTMMVDPIASGYDILDGLAAITADDGRVHLFTSTYAGWIGHWTQTASGQTGFMTDAGGFPLGNAIGTAASGPTATKNQDGRLEVFWHGAGYADVMTAYQLVGGGWSGAIDLGNTGSGGIGPITAMRRTSGQIMLFARNGYDGVSATWQGAINSSFVGWTDLQNQFPAYPAAATDANGHGVVAGVGVDGRLYIRREVSGVGSFGAWTVAGD
jgi:LmbE family N-acetylglucosaminyl deacetylase